MFCNLQLCIFVQFITICCITNFTLSFYLFIYLFAVTLSAALSIADPLVLFLESSIFHIKRHQFNVLF